MAPIANDYYVSFLMSIFSFQSIASPMCRKTENKNQLPKVIRTFRHAMKTMKTVLRYNTDVVVIATDDRMWNRN